MSGFDRSALKELRDTAERYSRNLTSESRGYLNARGLTDALISEYLLGTCDDLHEGWISIPYLRPSGVVGFKFRNPVPGVKPKYKSLGPAHLYNTWTLDVADSTGEIAITEGELDALVASELCGVPAVGIPGATQWTGNPHWRELFAGYQRVWILADPDEAGLGLASAILEALPASRLVKLPGDVNDTYLAHGGIREFMNG